MQLGMVGLGRMGGNMTRRLLRGGHEVVVYDHSSEAVGQAEQAGAVGASTIHGLVAALHPPRAVWLMVPAGIATERAIDEISGLLSPGDTVIDGGNSYFKDDVARAERLSAKGLHYVDVGTSGGVWGLERGYCMTIGGPAEIVERLDPLFDTLAPGPGQDAGQDAGQESGQDAAQDAGQESGQESGDSSATTDAPATTGTPPPTVRGGYVHVGPAGAGHFVKMIHNGIEYGIMAAYAEGFNIMKHANVGKQGHEASAEQTPLRDPEHYQYDFDLGEVAELWRRGSVVASWLLDLTANAFLEDPGLERFAGRVSDSGEGRWTIQAAVDEAVPAHVLTAALFERFSSRGEADFADKLLSAMRFQFGGHEELPGKK
jgi:6-phosphogluconate dehydrogenase